MTELVSHIEPILDEYTPCPRWLVAYSGGLDSTVLLHLLWRYLEGFGTARADIPILHAVHVHHGLNSGADDWQRHCEDFCRDRGISLDAISVEVVADGGSGPEAAARDARYGAINQLQQAGEVLFLGHHLDDQVETLILRLFRSSGVSGLAAMARELNRPQLRVRPLLDIPRMQLLDYARQQDLQWVEDESNADLRFSRNFVRHRLLPVIAEHWPDHRAQLAALSRSAADDTELLAEVAVADLDSVADSDRWGCYLKLKLLNGFSAVRIRNMVNHWLHRQGVPALRQRQWRAFFEDIIAADPGASPVLQLHHHRQLHRYRDAVYLVGRPAEILAGQLDAEPPYAVELGAAGRLFTERVEGQGLDPARRYEIRYRRGGERVRAAGWTHSKSLKHYLQEQGVPPWWRPRVPLLYSDGLLAAVADFCICDGFVAAPGRAGARIVWKPTAATS